MPALHRMAAVRAHADMHVEPAIDDGAGNFGLVLLGDVSFADPPVATTRTGLGQRHLVALIDPRRHGSMRMRPVAPARLAAWRFRLGRRLVLLAKRSSLALGFAAQLLDQQQQLLNLCLEPAIFRAQLFVRWLAPRRTRVIVRSVSRRAHIGCTTRIQLAD